MFLYINFIIFQIDLDQEAYATGVTFVASSFIGNVGLGVSGSRLFQMGSCGGRTQIAYIVAAITTLLVVLVLSDYADHLPSCVVAAILFVAFSSGIKNLRKLPKYWRQDKSYALIFVFTALIGLLMSYSYSIVFGIVLSMVVTLFRTAFPSIRQMKRATLSSNSIWVDGKVYKNAKPLRNILVFKINGALFFACSEYVKECVITKLQNSQTETTNPEQMNNDITQNITTKNTETNIKHEDLTWHVIIDFSAVSYIDIAGMRMLTKLKDVLMDKYGTTLKFACCSESVRSSFLRAPKIISQLNDQMYLTIGDAVNVCQYHEITSSKSHIYDVETIQMTIL